MSTSLAETICTELVSWIDSERLEGWDPFDALNSEFLKSIAGRNWLLGLLALHTVKRSPLNLRPVLRIPKTVNAKGHGLIAAASVRLYAKWGNEQDLSRAISIANWLANNHAEGYSGACWGYPFDWPNRGGYIPKGTPTIVNTAFIGHAILEVYSTVQKDFLLSLARSACDFITKDLPRAYAKTGFCFSYVPFDESYVHNANLLGASLLARTGSIIDDGDLIEQALLSANYSISCQRDDGSWPYGEEANTSWIDSFHTGYNILALKVINEVCGEQTIKRAIDRAYSYYLTHFFLEDGTVKYYSNNPKPFDAHAFAHAILCLTEMANHPRTPPDLVDKVVHSMIDNFWSGNGYFFWQQRRGSNFHLPYLRWVQAWALLALASYIAKK